MSSMLIVWTLCSFVFLLIYSSNGKCYETSDNFNLLIYAICYPAFLLSAIVLTIIEKIEEEDKKKNG